MPTSPERRLIGLEALEAVTTLLQRNRLAHPPGGLFDAAELQWWWRTPRPTDVMPNLFWFGDDGRPEAALMVTAWKDHVGLDPIVLSGASPGRMVEVMERGLAHAEECGFGTVGLEIDQKNETLRRFVTERGFELDEGGLVESWLPAEARPAISPLTDGYRLTSRQEDATRPHPMIGRLGPEVEARLRQTSLYRPELDLAIVDEDGAAAAYGLFWFDPVTAIGLVEPMRTEDAHQRRGLARHVLTAGVDLLARAGATRIKICFEPDNPASGHLYVSVGFVPTAQTDAFIRRT